jgi:dTDP-4-dehydrorhamnose 3,5-epimerase
MSPTQFQFRSEVEYYSKVARSQGECRAVLVRSLAIPDLKEIVPDRHEDERGILSEIFNSRAFAERGLPVDWVQDNHSKSTDAFVLRGLHFQRPPFAQDKLVRVVRGSVFDVAVDLRSQSRTYAKWAGLELSARKWNQIFIPKGFAHGFLTLEPETEVIYKVSAHYSPQHEVSIRFDDDEIVIDWPLRNRRPQLSRKDADAPLLRNIETGF